MIAIPKAKSLNRRYHVIQESRFALFCLFNIFLPLVFAMGLASPAAAKYMLFEAPTGQRFSMGSFRMTDGSTHEELGVVWLDNQRIIYRGTKSAQNPDGQDAGIFIWDTAQNRVTRYGKETRFCYADGWAYLSESPWYDEPSNRSTQHYRYGPFGQEKPGFCERKGSEYRNCILSVNMSCKVVMTEMEVKRPLGPESRVVFELRDGDGMLVVARRWGVSKEKQSQEERVALSRQPVLLLNKQHPKGKALPILEVESIEMRRAAFSEYANKYTFVGATPKDSTPGHLRIWPEGRPQPVYLMNRTGETEIIEVSKIPDWTSIIMAMPSRQGLVFWGGHGRTGGGLFLYDGTRTDAIDRGYVGTFSVTPDGCKVAYSIINDYGKTRDNTFRIKYANLCDKVK